MKKILLILLILIFSFSFSSFSETEQIRSVYKTLNDLLINNNPDLGMQRNNIKKATYDYNKAYNKSRNLNTDYAEYEFFGETKKLYYSNDIKAALRLQKYLIPASLEFALDMQKEGLIAAEKGMSAGLRDMIAGLYSAQTAVDIAGEKYELEKEKYDQESLKYSYGMIIKNQLDESGLKLKSAQNAVTESERKLENFKRTLSQFIGIDLKSDYTRAVLNEDINTDFNTDSGFYILKAFETDMKIKNIEGQINLIELEMDIYEETNTHNSSYRERYEELDESLQELTEIDLVKAKNDIYKAIENSHIKIINAKNDIDILQETIKMQKNSLNELKLLYENGMILKTSVTAMEIAIEELEINYRLAVYSYNTSIIKLENDTGIERQE
jgi:outer membrane protein TolC